MERTLLDLAGVMTRRRAAIALDSALRRNLTTLGSLDRCLYLTARRGRNGCAVLRDLIQERMHLTDVPESPLESTIWDLLARSGLPMPVPQFVIRSRGGDFVARVDFAYLKEKLVIEGHSKTWHWGVQAHSDDAARHNAISEQGFRIVYLTWTDATQHGDSSIRLISELLANSASETAL